MYKKKNTSWAKHLDFLILDLIAIELSLFIGFAIRYDGDILFFSTAKHFFLYENLAKIIPIVQLIVVFLMDPYTGILRRNKFQELTKAVYHCLAVFAGCLLYMYLNQTSFYYSRLVLGFIAGGSIVITYFIRVFRKRIIRKKKLADTNKSNMLIVASNETVDKCLYELAHNKYADYTITGVVITNQNRIGETIDGVEVVASTDTVLDYVRDNVIDQIYIDAETQRKSEQLAVALVELGVTVHICLIHDGQMMPNRIIENYGDFIVITSSMHIANDRQIFIKRLMDICGAIVGLIFCGIAFIIFAPIIKFTSEGPVFFGQTRIGLNGRKFKIYKFRSMYKDAEARKAELMKQNELSGNVFKMDNDPRITPVGRFIRKYSIDELPQFWNILKGDMSLVGTRPPTEDEVENYAYHHKARLAIKPGLTGMWQVSGRNDIKDFEEIVALDTEYISNWSLGLDIKILFKTVMVVLTARGSK